MNTRGYERCAIIGIVMRIYLETSVISYVLNNDYPDKQKVAKKTLDLAGKGEFEAFVSDVVIGELDKSPEDRKDRLLNLVKDFKVLPITEEVEKLVEKYLEEDVFPATKRADATHVAVASVFEMDFIFSWNFRHIVRVWTKEEVEAVNKLMGYKVPKIVIPEEVI